MYCQCSFTRMGNPDNLDASVKPILDFESDLSLSVTRRDRLQHNVRGQRDVFPWYRMCKSGPGYEGPVRRKHCVWIMGQFEPRLSSETRTETLLQHVYGDER